MKMTDNSTKEGYLSYTETTDALSTRIRAHKQYSNFSLEDWIGNTRLSSFLRRKNIST